jgi:glycosyltransferase involved in cell wall biosynthesis
VRILHVGSGFRPLRRGGLVAYTEDLMDEQARRGHQLAYFFSGREYPFVSGPRLRRWWRGRIAMLEVVNSPLFDHGRQPDLELAEPRIERMFGRVLREHRPDVLHVHELAGLPTSVLDVAADDGTPLIVTLHDYFPLCSTFRLLDSQQRVCLRPDIGEDCIATTAADPRAPGLIFEGTLCFHALRHPLVRRLNSRRVDSAIRRLAAEVGRHAASRASADGRPSAAAFQRRRDVNVRRLNRAERLVAVSGRVGEIYALLGVDPGRIVTTRPMLAHIERLHPRHPNGQEPVRFATLGAGESVAKGAQLLLQAVRSLGDAAAAGRFRLLVFGFVDTALGDALAGTPGVELRGPYTPEQLDDLLEDVDVGIMPSVWEEAFGLAGIEFLAKGIPVIGNAIGGIVEYTRDGETGWLNRSRSADELASIMRNVIEQPGLVSDLNAKIRSKLDSIVVPLGRHADEMDELYRGAIAARAG